jgi:hypothetical protein
LPGVGTTGIYHLFERDIMTNEKIESTIKDIMENVRKIVSDIGWKFDMVQHITAALVKLSPAIADALFKGHKVQLEFDKGVLNLKVYKSDEVDYIEIN